MTETKPYIPIDCNFYDRLEAWSVTKQEVRIKKIDSGEEISGLIKDLFIREKAEFLLLDSGQEVRLDKIESVNGIELNGSCEVTPAV